MVPLSVGHVCLGCPDEPASSSWELWSPADRAVLVPQPNCVTVRNTKCFGERILDRILIHSLSLDMKHTHTAFNPFSLFSSALLFSHLGYDYETIEELFVLSGPTKQAFSFWPEAG